MALPEDVTTFTLTFGAYTDGVGEPALVGATAKLFPVDPSTNRRIRVNHLATGSRIVPADILVTVLDDGTATVAGLPHTGQESLTPVGWAWRVEWDLTSYNPSNPGNLTFAVPSGTTVDFDLLTPAATVPPVAISLPEVLSVAGSTGAVTAEDLAEALDLADKQDADSLDADVAAAVVDTESATSGALRAAYVAQFDITGKTAAQINTYIAADGPLTSGGKVHKRLIGTVTLDGSLVVPSRRLLDFTDATLELADGLNVNMLRNTAHLTSAATATDGAMTSGSAVVTTALADQAEVGQSCYVAGADDEGRYPLCGIVSAVDTGANTITLIDPWGDPALAEATVAAAAVTLYDRDRDIEIIGGTWDRGNNGWRDGGVSATHDRVTFGFSRVDGITLRDNSLAISDATQKGWNLLLADVTDYKVIRPRFNSTGQNTDGLDIHGPAKDGWIERPRGTTGDDFVAFHAASSAGAPSETCGDIKGCTLIDINPTAASQAAVKLRASGTTKIRDIHGDVIRGTALQGLSLKALSATANDVSDVHIGVVDCATTGNAVRVFSTATDGRIEVGTVNAHYSAAGDDSPMIYVDPLTTLGELVIGSLSLRNTPGLGLQNDGDITTLDIGRITGAGPLPVRRLLHFRAGGSIGTCRVGSVAVVKPVGDTNTVFDIDDTFGSIRIGSLDLTAPGGANTPVFDLSNCATPGEVVVDSGALVGGRRLLLTNTSTGACRVAVSKFRLDGAHSLASASSTVEFMLHGLDVVSTVDTGIIRQGTGTAVTVRGEGMRNPTNRAGLVGTPTTSARVVHSRWRCDVSLLAKTDGDTAFNTNAALACGTGVVISNGTQWKNLYSGAATV